VVISARAKGSTIVLRAENPVQETFAVDASIFTPFKRLSTGGEGTGLGLSIVDRVAKLHGGSASAGCSDARFWIELTLPV
jgi:C4-dicarboxylate-specific signal transduction histidine kinase